MTSAERSEELKVYGDATDTLAGDALPIIDEIAHHTKVARKAVRQDPVDTFTISNELVELSILLQRLGDRISTIGQIKRAVSEFYDRAQGAERIRLVQEGTPAGNADAMKVELTHDIFLVMNNADYIMDRLVYARKATDKTIDSIRSKLSYEKTNERNA